MKIKNIFTFLFFLAVIIPSFGACNSNSSFAHKSKYLLNGTFAETVDGYDYYSINNGDEYAVALNSDYINETTLEPYSETFNGKAVTGIYRNGFFNSKCESIPILPSIEVIDYEAFMGSKIKSITIPVTVTEIGESAFYSCKSLEKVVIQNSSSASSASSACTCVSTSSSSSSNPTSQQTPTKRLTIIPAFCFFNCVNLRELVLPESIKIIGHEAFQGCSSLFSTLALSSIEKIEYRAFQGCSALKKVYIGDSFFKLGTNNLPVGVIEEFAFVGCYSKLEFFLVSQDTDNITTWLGLSDYLNWNQKSEYSNPGSQIDEDVGNSTKRYEYHVSQSGGASYTSDWIYAIGTNGEVEISSYIGPTEINGVGIKFLVVPDYLGSNNPVTSLALNIFESVKSSLVRLYLPKTLKRIQNSQFGDEYTNLVVIDDNTSSKCTTDSSVSGNLIPRIILSGLTDLRVIGKNAFLNLPSLTSVETLELPSSLEAVGSNAFGSTSKHMQSVTNFKWYYADPTALKPGLKVIGKEAFYKLGNPDTGGTIATGIHNDYITSDGTHNYELTTLVFPRNFAHFGITSTDSSTYSFGGAEDAAGFGESAFAGCPLISKVVFKGSSKTNESYNDDSCNLVIPAQTFAMNASLRTVVFEERYNKSIVFHTGGGQYKPTIGWSSGKHSNDFGGDPALQTLVLPNKHTTLYIQNYAFQGNSRGVIYLSAGSTNKIYGSTEASCTTSINTPDSEYCAITADDVKDWRTIGDEEPYTTGIYPGYCFAEHNHFGIDQKMPLYDNVYYTASITATGISTTVLGVSGDNSKDYIEENKCSFVCTSSAATMTNYLYDRYSSTFTGTARVPATVGTGNIQVTAIGASAFSAAYCDDTSYINHTNYKDLTAVEIPDTIASIGEYAFMRAYGVTKLSAYDSNGDLKKPTNDNNSVAGFVMPSSLTTIGKHAFAFCNIEKFLNIPLACVFHENAPDANADDYETSVFSNNFSLRKITFGANATYSTYYKTSTYTHKIDQNTNDTYTSAIYSTDATSGTFTRNKSSLLLVLNRDSADYKASSGDVEEITVTVDTIEVEGSEEPEEVTEDFVSFDGKYNFNNTYVNSAFLYGAFKMCYWITALTVGTANNSNKEQPLISGISTNVYLNQSYNFKDNGTSLKSVSFGGSATIATPAQSFAGCDNLTYIKLPRVTDGTGTVPPGLLNSVDNPHIRFEVPKAATGTETYVCPEGVLDLTYTGYTRIEAEAFKNTGITTVKAPITTNFTIEEDAFGQCTNLASFDFSNVTGTVTLNGAFRKATIHSNLFNFGTSAKIRFGAETFKECKFPENSFEFPAKTALIGDSCFEGCAITTGSGNNLVDYSLKTVTAAATLTELERVLVDTGTNQNNAGDTTGFKQIGDFAFFQCYNLTNFDFTNFEGIERIGHLAFGMAKTNNNAVKSAKVVDDVDKNKVKSGTTTICTGGIVDLPSSLKNLGVGAFYGTRITSVTINSSNSIKFERAGDRTSNPRISDSGNRTGGQFRYCPVLTTVYFSHPDCEWKTEDLPKGSKPNEGQDSYFANCNNLLYVYIPYDYELYQFENKDDKDKRPDSMVWGSNGSKLQFYLYHDITYYNGTPICQFWHRTSAQNYDNLVFYMDDIGDLLDDDNELLEKIGDNKFWTTVNGEDVYLGKAIGSGQDSNGSYVIFNGDGTSTNPPRKIDSNGNITPVTFLSANLSGVINNGVIADATKHYVLKDSDGKYVAYLGTAYYYDSTGQNAYFTNGYIVNTSGVATSVEYVTDLSTIIDQGALISGSHNYVLNDSNGAFVAHLGSAYDYDSTNQVVYFSNGYTLDSTGTYGTYGLISDLTSVVDANNAISDSTTVFYYYDNGTLYCLGTADSVSVDPDTQEVTVTFSSGATLTSAGVFTAPPVQP